MKVKTKKLHLLTSLAMFALSLLNVQTAFAYITPGGESNRITPVIPRPGSPVAGPNRPRPYPAPRPPSYPRPIPYPEPVYPGPVYPGPGYPRPIPVPYPGPVYPGPINPGPIYNEYKTVHLNRWVYSENFYVRQIFDYSYAGYRLKSVRIDVTGNANARVNLIINGQIVDSRFSSGNDVYLYPSYYNDDLLSEIRSLTVNFNGTAYVNRMVFELEPRY